MRKHMRTKRLDLSAPQLQQHAEAVCERLVVMDVYRSAQHIAVYWAVNGEVGLDPVIEDAWGKGKHVYLPVLENKALLFSPYRPDTPLKKNRLGLPEPDVHPSAALSGKNMDLVLMPLVAFDSQGHRMGMGGGFYDRSFAFRLTSNTRMRPVLLGIAHDFQRVDRVHREPWDVPLDGVITEFATYLSKA